jgi:hypothetical protein
VIRVIKKGPDPRVAKKVVCRDCGATLEYVPKDVRNRQYLCMGEMDTLYFIKCPECKSDVEVRSP